MRDSVVQAMSFLLILAAIALISGCKNSSPQYTAITENDVITIMNEVGKATLAKDLDGVINHLAPFVVINVTMMGGSAEPTFMPQQIQMTRDQYKEELKKVFSKLTLHQYKRENDKIMISDDKRSVITETDVIEVMVIEGKETRTTTHERAVLEIIDGKLMVTHLDAVIVERE